MRQKRVDGEVTFPHNALAQQMFEMYVRLKDEEIQSSPEGQELMRMMFNMHRYKAAKNMVAWQKTNSQAEVVRDKFKKLIQGGKKSQEKVFSTIKLFGLNLPATHTWVNTPPGSVILHLTSNDSELLDKGMEIHTSLVGQSSFGEHSQCDLLHITEGRGAMAHSSEYFHSKRVAMYDLVPGSTYDFYIAIPLKQRHASIGRWIESIARASIGKVCFEAMPEDGIKLVGSRADMAYLDDLYQHVFASPDHLQPLRPPGKGVNCVEFVVECVQLAVMHLNKISLDGGYQVVELPILNLDSRTAQPQQLMGALQDLCYFEAVAQCQHPSIQESILQNQKRIIEERKEQAKQLADVKDFLVSGVERSNAESLVCPAGNSARLMPGEQHKLGGGAAAVDTNDAASSAVPK